MRLLLAILLSLLSVAPLCGQDGRTAPTDLGASLMVVTPGETPTSLLGHMAIRMSCPSVGLDYCFTTKVPELGNVLLTLTMEKTKVGLVPEPTGMFVEDYRHQGRGLTEYPLRISVEAKRLLWQRLDEEVARGLYRPVDYVRHGCGEEVVRLLLQAIPEQRERLAVLSDSLVIGATPRLQAARYEACDDWLGLTGHSILAGVIDQPTAGLSRLIMPEDIVTVLQQADLIGEGTTVLTAQPTVPFPLTPFLGGLLFLCLCLIPRREVDWLVLPLQTAVGLLLCFIVFVGKAPGTEWNWLLVAFNPLPLLLLRWHDRRKYLGYAVALTALLVYMLTHLGTVFFLPQLPFVLGLLVRCAIAAPSICFRQRVAEQKQQT